jgi:hypothetical protein
LELLQRIFQKRSKSLTSVSAGLNRREPGAQVHLRLPLLEGIAIDFEKRYKLLLVHWDAILVEDATEEAQKLVQSQILHVLLRLVVGCDEVLGYFLLMFCLYHI